MNKRGFIMLVSTLLFAWLVGVMIIGMIQVYPEVEILGFSYDIMTYEGTQHQIFSGNIQNSGGAPAHDVIIHVSWFDGHINEYVDSLYIGTLEPGESKPFKIVFETKDVYLVQYYTKWFEYT